MRDQTSRYRRKTSKARRDLQATIAQIDALLPALADKPSRQADILCEKASAVKTVLALEAEERETEQELRIKELEAGHQADSRRIAELTQQNRELQVAASKREVVTITDPNHSAVREERDGLQHIMVHLAATWADEMRAGAAVKAFQSCRNPAVVETFCRAINVDWRALEHYMGYLESPLRGLRMAKDFNGVLVRAILAEKFPPPAS
jgi:hypothetical protein